MTDDLYETDFVLWTELQAEALRQAAREGSNLPLDWENVAEEIESLGRRDCREVERYVRLILIHLAKLACSPADDPRRKWTTEVQTFRLKLSRTLKESPSLRRKIANSYEENQADALEELELSLREYDEAVPERVLADRLKAFTLDEVLDRKYLPARTAPAES